MNSKNNFIPYYLFGLIFLMLFLACPDPSIENRENDGRFLERPENVIVEIVDGKLIIHWDRVTNAEDYQIFRSENDGEFVLLGTSEGETEFTDSYPLGFSDIQFAVKSFSGDNYSPLSAPSGKVFMNVQNVYADKFSSANKINIRWDRHEQAEAYRIIRFDSASQDLSEAAIIEDNFIPDSQDLISLSYSDTSAELEETYWYRICWIESSNIHGENSILELGICSNEIDYSEPENNDYVNVSIIDPADSTLMGVADPIPNYIYSVNNENGGRFDDIDWFGISDPLNESYSIEIVFDSASQKQFIVADDIDVHILYNGIYRSLDNGNIIGNVFTYILEQTVLDADCPIYFRVSPRVAAADDRYGKYTFQIKKGF